MVSTRVARLRHRIQAIELNPAISSCEISVKLLVNGTTVYELSPIEAGQQLHWKDLILICDVTSETKMSVKIVKKRHLKPDCTGLVRYLISEVSDKDEIALKCDDPPFSIKLRFFGKEMAEDSYANALMRAEEARRQEGTPGNVGKTARAFRALIDFGETIENLDPTGSTKMVIGICNDAWEHWEQQRRGNEMLNQLVEGLAAILPSINSAEQLADSDLRRTVTDMLFLIEDAAVFVIGYQLDKLKVHTVYSALSPNIENKAEEFITRLTRLKDEFDRGIALQTLQGVQALGETARKLDALQLQWTSILLDTQAMIPGGHSNNTQRIYWIHGFAGLGKSSIAASVCQKLEARNTLAGSFFCKRDDPDLRDPRRVLNTIVYGLATRCEPYGLEVAKAIQGNAQLCTYHIQRRYAGLVRRPLESLGELKTVGNLVVVIDALDECEVGEVRASLLACLEGMSRLVPWLRLILTSRPEKDIKHAIERADNHVISCNLYEQEVSGDMHTFVRKRMTDIATESGVAWSETEIKQLVQRSNGLFIWAATACKFIEEGINVESRLKEIIGDTHSTYDSHPLAALDELYEGAIWYSITNKREDNRLMSHASKKILSGEVGPNVVDAVVKSLGSVLYEDGGAGGPIRLYHPSFEDYLISRSECFRVDLAELDNLVARCCLNVMLKELRFNICGLETSYLLNRDVHDLQKRICDTIGMHLQYSCLHWSSHLDLSQRGLEETLRSFLCGETLMYWIEVLSLLNKLDVGLSSLLKISGFNSTAFSDCSSYADDAYRFALAFYDVISESTPHLYLSALPFAPAKSGIAQRIRPRFPNIPAIVSGGDEEWPPRLQTRRVSSSITVLKLTSDGSRIISGHKNGFVQVRDVDTGAMVLDFPIQTYLDDSDGSGGSNDPDDSDGLFLFRHIAVGCDNRLIAIPWGATVRMWSLETGIEVPVAMSHRHQFQTIFVDFSPSGDLIASSSQKGELEIWRVQTGEPVLNTRIDIGEGYLKSILFHRHHLYTLSELGSKIITHTWDGSACDIVPGAQLPWGWSYVASSSAKNLCLVALEQETPHQPAPYSSIHNHSFIIWDLVTGAEVLKLKSGPGRRLKPDLSAFSPDGQYFVSAFPNSTVRVWDTCTGEIVGNLEHFEDYMMTRHSGSSEVKCSWIAIACSPRNHPVISASHFKSVMNIWSTDKHLLFSQRCETSKLLKDLGPIALSPDGHHIFSDGFHFWDSSTGALIRRSSNCVVIGDPVPSLAFSPDGRFIALGLTPSGSSSEPDKFKPARMAVCDANSGAVVHELEYSPYTTDGQCVSFLGRNLICSYNNSNGSLRAWDLKTQTIVRDLPNDLTDNKRRISTSSEGQVLAFYTRDTVEAIGAESWTQIALLQHPGSFLLLNFSPNGRKIVSVSEKNIIQLWDVTTETRIFELRYDYYICCDITPIACSHGDTPLIAFPLLRGQIQVLDTAPGAPKYYLIQGHSDQVNFVEFCRGSRRIVSHSSKIRVHDIDACGQEVESLSYISDNPRQSLDLLLRRCNVAVSLLARHISSGGWVATASRERLIWLPVEWREIDDSSLCISKNWSVRRGVVLDMSRFVHGTAWTIIKGDE